MEELATETWVGWRFTISFAKDGPDYALKIAQLETPKVPQREEETTHEETANVRDGLSTRLRDDFKRELVRARLDTLVDKHE